MTSVIHRLHRRHGQQEDRTASTVPATPHTITLPDIKDWTSPALSIAPLDTETWPFRGDEDAFQTDGYRMTGWLVMYVLDVRTGELRVRLNKGSHAHGPDCRRGGGGFDVATGIWVRQYESWTQTPDQIGFCRGGYRSLLISEIARELTLIAPFADQLLRTLQPVPGTGEWDWTVDAVFAHDMIDLIVSRGNCDAPDDTWIAAAAAAGPGGYQYAISFEDLLGLYPELQASWPALAALPGAALDELAIKLSQSYGAPHPPPGLLPPGDNEAWHQWNHRITPRYGTSSPRVTGARAGLYRLRQQLVQEATGYPVFDAAQVLAANPSLWPRLDASMTDAELQAAADTLYALAARDHQMALAGIVEALTAERATLRAEVRTRLEQVANAADAAETEARRLRTARTALIGQVISWADPADQLGGDVDMAALAALAHLPVAAMDELRAALETEPSHALIT